jgi:hypothetical protein
VVTVDMEHRGLLSGQVRAAGGGGAGALAPECGSSLLTRWLCDPAGTAVGAGESALRWAAELIAVWWPLLLVGAVAVVVLAVAVGRARARARRWAVASATWWEIRPPARMPADGAVALWRMLLGHLAAGGDGWAPHARRGLGRAGRRVAIEVWAAQGRVRVGVWVPGGVDPDVIGRAVGRALPGARLARSTPPTLDDAPGTGAGAAGAVQVREVRPSSGPWTALVDPTPQRGAVSVHARPATETGQEPLRAVYAALADCPPGYRACWQVVITPHRPRGGAAGGPISDRVGALALTGLRRLVLATLDLVLFMITPQSTPPRGAGPGGATRDPVDPHRADPRRVDPVAQTRQREANLKQAFGPHAVTTIRLAVAGPHPAGCRRVLADIMAGHAMALPVTLTFPRRVWRARHAVAYRASRGGLYATAAELAAMGAAGPVALGRAAHARRPAETPHDLPPAAAPRQPHTRHPETRHPQTRHAETRCSGTRRRDPRDRDPRHHAETETAGLPCRLVVSVPVSPPISHVSPDVSAGDSPPRR